MKNLKFLLTLFLSISYSVFAQTGTVSYFSEFPNNKKINSERTKKIVEEVNRSNYTLTYNKERSFFSQDKKIPLYKLEAKLAAILVKANLESYQFNSIKKESFINPQIKNKTYIVDESTKMNDWVLENEVKIIDGYKCFKATKEIYYPRTGVTAKNIAWYTPDLPVPFGPTGYGGLPGLILQLKIGSRVVYLAKKIKLNPKKIYINKLKKGEKISLEKFIQLKRDTRKYTKD